MSAKIDILPSKLGDIGAFQVHRALPSARRRMVGPFIFWDEMGPAEFAPGKGLDVRPHPHIGLATVTYLFEGRLMHRDTLGVVENTKPGDVNVMVSGRGIVHSERTGDAERAAGQKLHGIQAWIALPEEDEEIAPLFNHQSKADLPKWEEAGGRATLILGHAYGLRSPARTFSPTVYLDVHLDGGAGFRLPDEHEECAVYVISGSVRLGDETVSPHQMAVLGEGDWPLLEADEAAHVMVLGGAPLGRRNISWNFVSHSKERIAKAEAEWRASIAGGFENTVFSLPPGESEHIPLPQDVQTEDGPPECSEEIPTT